MNAPNSLLELVQSQSEITESLVGDVISTGTQIRIKIGEKTITPVDGQQTFALFKEMGITRCTVRNQGGMLVVSMTLTTMGETVGLLGPDGQEIILPVYTDQAFATWRTWVHLLNVEMMNANEESIKALTEYLDSRGFVQWVRRTQPGQEPRERTTETIYDKEVPGSSLMDRHASAPRLKTVTLVPDSRDKANWTKYEKKDGTPAERWGFTSFPDTILTNTANVIEAFKLPADTEDRSDRQRTMNNRLSLLTGTDPDSEYSTRPTIGYVSFQPTKKPDGVSDEEFAATVNGGREINLFSIKVDTPTESSDENTIGDGSVAGDSDDPFDGMDGNDES